MLRRNLFIAGIAVIAGTAVPSRMAASQTPTSRTATLDEVKVAVLATTGYDRKSVEIAATKVQFVVTVVNSPLADQRSADRNMEASRIASAISRTISAKADFKSIQAIHVDYVKRTADGRSTKKVDAIDFRKDPQGNFQHHIT